MFVISLLCSVKIRPLHYIRLTLNSAQDDVFAVITVSFDLSAASLIVDEAVPTSISTLLTQLLSALCACVCVCKSVCVRVHICVHHQEGPEGLMLETDTEYSGSICL